VVSDDLSALTSLADPTRRRLYDLVVEAARPLGRDEAAAAAGIGRPLAAYHLDKLVESGLLEARYARPPGRFGPGAGRPAKLYRRGARPLSVQLPARRYEVLADVLVQAVREEPALRAAVEQAARATGERAGRSGAAGAVEILRERGYEPFEAEPGVLRLRNCPFDAAAAAEPELVCGLNLALVQGLLAGIGAGAEATLEPREGCCCVAIRRR